MRTGNGWTWGKDKEEKAGYKDTIKREGGEKQEKKENAKIDENQKKKFKRKKEEKRENTKK
jgi:hypothetical protein